MGRVAEGCELSWKAGQFEVVDAHTARIGALSGSKKGVPDFGMLAEAPVLRGTMTVTFGDGTTVASAVDFSPQLDGVHWRRLGGEYPFWALFTDDVMEVPSETPLPTLFDEPKELTLFLYSGMPDAENFPRDSMFIADNGVIEVHVPRNARTEAHSPETILVDVYSEDGDGKMYDGVSGVELRRYADEQTKQSIVYRSNRRSPLKFIDMKFDPAEHPGWYAKYRPMLVVSATQKGFLCVAPTLSGQAVRPPLRSAEEMPVPPEVVERTAIQKRMDEAIAGLERGEAGAGAQAAAVMTEAPFEDATTARLNRLMYKGADDATVRAALERVVVFAETSAPVEPAGGVRMCNRDLNRARVVGGTLHALYENDGVRGDAELRRRLLRAVALGNGLSTRDLLPRLMDDLDREKDAPEFCGVLAGEMVLAEHLRVEGDRAYRLGEKLHAESGARVGAAMRANAMSSGYNGIISPGRALAAWGDPGGLRDLEAASAAIKARLEVATGNDVRPLRDIGRELDISIELAKAQIGGPMELLDLATCGDPDWRKQWTRVFALRAAIRCGAAKQSVHDALVAMRDRWMKKTSEIPDGKGQQHVRFVMGSSLITQQLSVFQAIAEEAGIVKVGEIAEKPKETLHFVE
jgi:hypothetical protein